ncbi:MAG: hypothetical protein DSM106950_24315 [Stigonema ocellatum SAG 48.90 = DSM 106950]|nr:hypothetical protein [Stigonema ocellatum SAG 48.90 = DSM 106950]
MPLLELTVEQVIELVKQLPSQDQYAVLHAIKASQDAWWLERVARGEQNMRRISAERGLDWDKMSEEEREAFVDSLMHEDE